MLILKRIGLTVLGLVVLLLLTIGLLFLDRPSTPPILNQNGESQPNAIAQMEYVEIGGIPQWLLIRSHNLDNPPLLVVHGGPGSPEAELFRAFNGDLERHFTVVHWHQRGAGRTRTGSESASDYRIDTFLSDVDEVVRHVYERFGQQKLFFLGHSWGSVLGVRYVREHPERIAAYIGVGQVTDMVASEQLGCDYIREQAELSGDLQAVEDVDSFCHPPFTPDYVIRQRQLLSRYKGDMQELTIPKLGMEMFLTDEATLSSMIDFALGGLEALDNMWDELMEINFFEEPKTFDVPVFLALGRNDYQVSAKLATQYFEQITAPCKNLKWFEESGHSPMWEEAESFNAFLVSEVLTLAACESNSY